MPQHTLSRSHQSLHGNAVVSEDIRLASRNRVFVQKSGYKERYGDSRLHKYGCASFAQPAMYRMLFHGDNRAAFATNFEDCFNIERFDRVHAQHAALYAQVG